MRHLTLGIGLVLAGCGDAAVEKGSVVADAAFRAHDAAPQADADTTTDVGDPGDAAGAQVDADAAPPARTDAGADAAGAPGPSDAAAEADPDAASSPDAGEMPPPPPLDCPEPDPGEVADWRHGFASPATVGLGLPQHSAVEPIANPGAALSVAGKFAYGVISKDLEDEDVTLYVRLPGADPCGEWRAVGTATTDSDGRATVDVDPALVPEPGHYDFRLIVLGDHTEARGALWVVEPGTAFVLFDVDGTLTIGDSEIFEQVLLGQDPEMYAGADEVAQTWFDAGYQPLYVTGRPYSLNLATRTWLRDRGFPQGPVRTTDDLQQALPTEGGVQTYKREYLLDVMASTGVVIPAAYGNATTDICAYAQAGIDPASTWIIGPNAGGACDGFAATQPLADYPSHLPALADLPPAP